MYELDLVRKRKRKIAAWIVVGASTSGLVSLSIIAFLGRFVGTFTVSVNNGEVGLSLSEKASFEKPESLLRIDDLRPYEETTFHALPSGEVLDNEDSPYTLGANYDDKNAWTTLNYFKYTFYVKNVGKKTAKYDISFNITESKPTDDGTERKLDDTLRVMIFDNEANSTEHNYKVYAKEAAEYNYLPDGTRTRREFIAEASYDRTEDEDHPLAELFLSGETVARYTVPGFRADDIRRYTLVAWLEGEDRQSRDDMTPPVGATIKLGVEINAYEN
ncbi:MAG: hypothetical protein IJU64_06625 [Bacilli bacterium]|nr:hypothetical protein [Bacilli bacterium]